MRIYLRKKWKNILLICFAVFICLLNLVRINDNYFWGDEAFTINLIRMNVGKLLVTTGMDVHPPLYYLILKFICTIFGEHGYILHLVSVIPILLVTIFSLIKVRKYFGNKAVAVFIALSTLMESSLVYNVEVRMYSWAFLFVFLCFWYSYELILQPYSKKNWWMFTVTGLASAYTHYYALISVAFIYASLFIILLIRDRKTFKASMVCSGITVLGYLPWLYFLLGAFKRSSDGWWSTQIPTIQNCINFVFGKSVLGYGMRIALAVSAIAFLIAKLIAMIQKKVDAKSNILKWEAEAATEIITNETALWIAIGIISVVGTIATGIIVSKLIRPLFLVRYLYQLTGVLWMITGVLFSSVFRNEVFTACLLAFVLFFGVKDWKNVCVMERELDLVNAESVEFIDEKTAKAELFVVESWEIQMMLECYFPEQPSRFLHDTDWHLCRGKQLMLFLNGKLSEELKNELIRQAGQIKFIGEGTLPGKSFFMYQVSFAE